MENRTPDAIAAIELYRDNNRRRYPDRDPDAWIADLMTAWMTGTDDREPQGHDLRWARNQLGPKWLLRSFSTVADNHCDTCGAAILDTERRYQRGQEAYCATCWDAWLFDERRAFADGLGEAND